MCFLSPVVAARGKQKGRPGKPGRPDSQRLAAL